MGVRVSLTTGHIASERIAALETFRKLGFNEDTEIFTLISKLTDPAEFRGLVQVVIEIRAQGRTFIYALGVVDDAPDQVQAAFKQVGLRWNKLSQAARHEIYERSAVRHQVVNIITALILKGFKIKKRTS